MVERGRRPSVPTNLGLMLQTQLAIPTSPRTSTSQYVRRVRPGQVRLGQARFRRADNLLPDLDS